MKILADRHIARARPAFSAFGEVVLFDPPFPPAAELHECDVLLVRSVTRVDPGLLRDSRVGFVGTATSGVDHIDIGYLSQQGIGFAAAPGSNARPVAEYVLSALSVLLERRAESFADLNVGIIGYGHVGSTLHGLLEALGATCLLNDPPLQEAGHAANFRKLDDVLQADVVTLHVPLTKVGAHPTRQLLDAQRLRQLRHGTILINTARGGVIDETALIPAMTERRLDVVLDVWDNEPAINPELACAVAIGTPHIAGYSLEAKLRATQALQAAMSAYFGIDSDWLPAEAGQQDYSQCLALVDNEFVEGARLAIQAGYDVRGDAAAMRRLDDLPASRRAGYFRDLRDDYRLRQEFPALLLQLQGRAAADADRYRQLGFQVESL